MDNSSTTDLVATHTTPNTSFDANPEAVAQEPAADVAAAPTNPQSALQELLKVHSELKTWLEHTGFFDIDHRRRVLDGVRQLRGLEEERVKVLQKIQSSKPVASENSNALVDSVDTLGHRAISPPREPSAHSRSRAIMPIGDMSRLSIRAGAKRDTRYFLVKSSNTTNVYMSRRDGLWITQAKNGPVLTQAFRECKAVVLFFSINKSKAFQGYAKMTSAPDHAIPHPPWIATTTQDMHTTEPFRIDWINEAETPFSQMGDLKNPYNEYNPVFVGRDGQEYPEDCGRRMMGIMDRVKAAQAVHPPIASADLHLGRARSKAEIKRRFAATSGPDSPASQRGSGLGGSRWKPGWPPPLYLGLEPETEPEHMNHGDEDLLLDYP